MFCIQAFRNCSQTISNILSKSIQNQALLRAPLKRSLLLGLLPIKKNLNERVPIVLFHTSNSLKEIKGFSEFFDDEENWGAEEVKVGRSWRKEELRIKSNQDLHKLWYVLLKERNMLLTMEEVSTEEFKFFANPERIDKVQESMTNLEAVVRERNRAYMLLETGETGEVEVRQVIDGLGYKTRRRFREHSFPDYLHPRVMNSPTARNPVRNEFSRLLREKGIKLKKREASMRKRRVAQVFKQFPGVNVEAVKAKFPDVDVDKVQKWRLARGNHDRNMG